MFELFRRLLGRQRKTEPTSSDERSRKRSVTAQILADGRAGSATGSRGAAPKPGAAAESFDPYNTGKFDRSASWERISRTQR